MDCKEFGKQMRAIRKSQKISQTTLAKMCGFRNGSAIHRIEMKDMRVLRTIFKMLSGLGYTIEFKKDYKKL